MAGHQPPDSMRLRRFAREVIACVDMEELVLLERSVIARSCRQEHGQVLKTWPVLSI
jgi:hypothetical protein